MPTSKGQGSCLLASSIENSSKELRKGQITLKVVGFIIWFSALDKQKMSSESKTTIVIDDPTCSESEESDTSSESSTEAAEQL